MVFGKYRAIKEIGRGATSVVYLAEEDDGRPRVSADPDAPADAGGDPFPNLEWGDGPIRPRYVAVKLVDFTDDRSKLSRRFRKLFATEAALTAQFDHPNIAKVYDWKMEDERAYLVMEYVEGDGLDRFVTMDKLLPMHQVVGIIFKVAMALDYAHRRGIVHRDIKPANVLLSKDDEVKLMDFGLALNIKKNVNVDSTFINGLGSPSYMSPEQIKGYTLNHQTDLYSLGVMFYHDAHRALAARQAEYRGAGLQDHQHRGGGGDPAQSGHSGAFRQGDQEGAGKGPVLALPPGRRHGQGSVGGALPDSRRQFCVVPDDTRADAWCAA